MNGMIRFDDKNLTISQLDISLIRQVLLTDKFDSLHVSDAPAITPSFEDFALLGSGGIEDTVKRAFRDHLVAQDRVELMYDLVLSVHQQLRALVPNREDLHVLVDDDAVTAAKQVKDLLPILIHASLGLQSLESDARTETTAQWREKAQRVTTEGVTTEFVVTSALYLIFKTELCQADKQDFYLQHVWAPRIHAEGPVYLRDVMDKQCNGYPLTKTWLKGLLVENRELTGTAPEFFRTLTRKGWVETILFRKDNATMLPEVFFFDLENIQLIRRVCQQAVAASALALHAGVTKRCEPTSELGMRREDLLKVLANNRSATYEDDIASAVVAMARAGNSSTDEASLRSRTFAVLRGQDPVIKLFDRRMQEAFVEVSVRDSARIPTKLQTGRLGHVGVLSNESQTELEKAAEESFCNKGLSFYASELGTLSALARRIIDLVLTIHQDLIEKSLREAMSA